MPVIIGFFNILLLRMALYVGNIPFSMEESELAALFSELGKVSAANIIYDRESGRSKGFGFVEYEKDALEAAAIQHFDGKEVEGRNLRVAKALPKER